MAQHQAAVVIAQVHAIALAVFEHVAVGTLVSSHPFPVAVVEEPVLPHIPETVSEDVALGIMAAYAQAARDIPVTQN